MDKVNEIFNDLERHEKSGDLDAIDAELDEEFDAKLAENESFAGKTINAHKMEVLNALKTALNRFCGLAPLCRVVGGVAVNTERHAHISLLLPLPVCINNPEARRLLATSAVLADDVFFANSDAGLVISFAVHDVWEA